ncbi:DNA cytosine methyltransferase [Nocardiopsis lambiniae]|uniref:DNA (cytosine-5-)-methyltransferase n=1 Tax=Nocardiopsis lambiniae TaxID=3075539 RepID=A0ABU2M2S8_9ACTN|nr:DNA cytosine methyltransferase [Nocardiopsis sp. DSM 44743]MDT0326955.1 DNA cytosine methyltransferase [Nocardiopsis sp. DSM 44743]
MSRRPSPIAGVDLFCGVGGLSAGLQQAGITINAGIDIDETCSYPFEANIGASFLARDVREISAEHLNSIWAGNKVRLLAGCAPCQPFSSYRRGVDTSHESGWPLLAEFGRLIASTLPELVTMENVPRIAKSEVFIEFLRKLRTNGYWVDWKSCYGPRYGLPQHRRRLVLVASKLGPIKVPEGSLEPEDFATVRTAIGDLPSVASGERHELDPLHASRRLSDINMKRIAMSKPGGTWEDWPEELRAECHRRSSGSTFKNVYARMSWDDPSPTITTLATNFGAGRFGHPEQDRPITMREAALLQGFPRDYLFSKPGRMPQFAPVTRLIGNAVPPPLAKSIGSSLLNHVHECSSRNQGK